MKFWKWSLVLAFLVNLSACNTPLSSTLLQHNSVQTSSLALARQKIKHVVIIMQENRSFDNYFGTYPGAEGFPVKDGKFTVCVNDPQKGTCVYPFHDPADRNAGGPHGTADATADIDGGKMDGFIQQAEKPQPNCQPNADTNCDNSNPQSVMGY